MARQQRVLGWSRSTVSPSGGSPRPLPRLRVSPTPPCPPFSPANWARR